jgi:porin
LIDRYFDTGLTFKAPIESRPDDSLGLGFAFGRISPAALASDGGSPPLTSAGFEAAIELTYQWQIAKNWTVQPDVQYILHPSGQLVNPPPGGNAPPIPNAAVFALRTVVNF